MTKKKIPMRMCAGCGLHRPKQELVRVVKAPDQLDADGQVAVRGEISLDLSGRRPGRGAYLCKNPDCLQAARKSRRLERSFSCRIPDGVYERLEEELAT